MKLETIKPADESAWSCVWVGVGGTQKGPVQSDFLHLIDWRLGGLLSRFILSKESSPVFVPTMGRLNWALVCFDKAPCSSIGQFLGQAERSKWDRVLFVTEDSAINQFVKEEVKQLKIPNVNLFIHYPEFA